MKADRATSRVMSGPGMTVITHFVASLAGGPG
jgi:hypothetical protein